MPTFKIIEDEYAIIIQKGLYKQVPIAEREGLIYAQISKSSYVSLNANKTTNKDKVRLIEVSCNDTLDQTETGRLCLSQHKNNAALVSKAKYAA